MPNKKKILFLFSKIFSLTFRDFFYPNYGSKLLTPFSVTSRFCAKQIFKRKKKRRKLRRKKNKALRQRPKIFHNQKCTHQRINFLERTQVLPELEVAFNFSLFEKELGQLIKINQLIDFPITIQRERISSDISKQRKQVAENTREPRLVWLLFGVVKAITVIIEPQQD